MGGHALSSPGGKRLVPGNSHKLKGLQFQRGHAGDSGFTTVSDLHNLWDWSGFIKPQLDLIAASGANAVKAFVGLSAVENSTISEATLLAHLRQFVSYCQTLNLSIVMTLWIGDEVTPAHLNPTLVTTAQNATRLLDTFPNVVAIDLGNEITIEGHTEGYGNEAGLRHLATLYPAIKGCTSIPLYTGMLIQSAGDLTSTLTRRVSAYCDVIGVHPYFTSDPVPADFAAFRAASFYKPFMIDECGRSFGDGTSAVQSRWLALRDLAMMPDCYGAIGYQTLTWGSPDYGMYPNLGGAVRTAISVPFALWPAY